DLLHNMLEELDELPKKAPDVMVYLKGSFETVLNRISLRGREFEIDESLREYYHFLWKDYDNWVQNYYNASEVLVIDMDKMDVVNNEADRNKLIELVEEKLKEVRNLEEIA
ncbi:MAG: deoxynucleoside kinase, partial [Clostridium sartagoforme]|nr:deoxynucleoside kinase [Clostridium sartagoforme]